MTFSKYFLRVKFENASDHIWSQRFRFKCSVVPNETSQLCTLHLSFCHSETDDNATYLGLLLTQFSAIMVWLRYLIWLIYLVYAKVLQTQFHRKVPLIFRQTPERAKGGGGGSVSFILVNGPMFVVNNKTSMFWAALQGISESRLNQYITIMIYMSHHKFTLMVLLIIYWINACPNEEQGISNATLSIQTFRASEFIVIFLVNKHF